MSHSRRSRYSQSPSPYRRYERSVSRSVSVSRSSSHIENPGNNLYVTGLSTRVTRRDLEKHFSAEGKVEDIHLVVDPRTRESRGFGFVTMSSLEEAERCIKYLDGSVLEGRVITVEKARRRRGRTPTPGRYLGLKTVRVSRRSPSYSSSYDRSRSQRDRSRSYSPYYRRRRSRSYSPYHSAPYSRERYDSRSRSPYWSPPGRRDWSYSARYSRERYYSRSRSPYWSPPGRRDRSYSPYNSRYYLPDNHYHRRSRYRCISPSSSPPRGRSYRRCVSPSPRRSYRRSHSPAYRVSRRSYSQSISRSWRSRRDYSLSRSGSGSQSSRSPSPVYRRSLRRSYSQSVSPRPRRRPNYSLSRSCSGSPSSRSVSRSVTPRFASPSS